MKLKIITRYFAPAVIVLSSITNVASAASISAVWANDGMDKVTQDEHRATTNPSSVINSVWDGTTIKQFGAKNEVVSFDIILEAASAAASNVNVTLSNFTEPGGAVIRSNQTRSTSNLYNWTTTEAELFYVRYLQIKGLSMYLTGDYYNTESFLPAKLRAPGAYPGLWTNRPNHDKFYPDIAVPLELHPYFTIAQGNNQGIWADIYIPKTAPTGQYTGTVTISESGASPRTVPVTLTVKNFTLPDTPSAKTMLWSSWSQDYTRYGASIVDQVVKNERLVAHRHKITLVGGEYHLETLDQPGPEMLPVLDGTLFTAANGYAGLGVGEGIDLYVIHPYGYWQQIWGTTQSAIQTHTNNWESWFQANSPATERFLYLIDESSNYAQTEQWAGWMKSNPGIGRNLKSFATIEPTNSVASVPSLDITASVFSYSMNGWPSAVANLKSSPGKKFYLCNGQRAGQGTFQTDDDATALRINPWIQYKMGVDRWFNYSANLYELPFSDAGLIKRDVFNSAQTYGGPTHYDTTFGQINTVSSSNNGDGVLFYPGTDQVYSASNYGVPGPFASLKMKYWRRGIQDVDYITMAKQYNSTAVTNIVNTVIPAVLWETTGLGSSGDYWVPGTTVGWSDTADDYEAQRLALANIIEGGQAPTRQGP